MTHRVIVPQRRPTSDVPYHHDRAPGQKYLVLADSVVAGSPIYVALRRVNVVPAEQPRWLDPHEHTCNSFYVFIGDGPVLAGLDAMVTLGEDTFPVSAPSAVLVPPRSLHHYWYTAGSGWYLQMTLSPEYTASLVPPDEMGRGPGRAQRREEVRRSARRRGEVWDFISPDLFDLPGVTVQAAALPSADALARPTAAEAACLDLVLGVGGMNPTFLLCCHGENSILRAPGAILNVGEPSMIASSGDGDDGSALVVRIIPNAPFSGRLPG